MFGSLGLPEILFILVLALLVFGPRRLPEVGRTIGKALGEFRRATGDLKRTFDQETSALERDVDLGSSVARPTSPTSGPARADSQATPLAADDDAETDTEAVEAPESEDGGRRSEPS